MASLTAAASALPKDKSPKVFPLATVLFLAEGPNHSQQGTSSMSTMNLLSGEQFTTAMGRLGLATIDNFQPTNIMEMASGKAIVASALMVDAETIANLTDIRTFLTKQPALTGCSVVISAVPLDGTASGRKAAHLPKRLYPQLLARVKRQGDQLYTREPWAFRGYNAAKRKC